MYLVIRNTVSVPGGEVYALDTVPGHKRTLDELLGFLRGNEKVLRIPAAGRCPLLPDAEFLDEMCFVKTEGAVLTTRTPDRKLRVEARPDYLARYATSFDFPVGASGHRLPETAFNVDELDRKTEIIMVEAADELDDPDL